MTPITDEVFRASASIAATFLRTPEFTTVNFQKGEQFHRAVCHLGPDPVRDAIEVKMKLAIEMNFAKGQAICTAFCGRGHDALVVTFFGTDGLDWPDIITARQSMMDMDNRGMVLHPAKVWLPEGVEVTRASGMVICDTCQKELYAHPQYRYPTDTNSAVRGCDGRYYHL